MYALLVVCCQNNLDEMKKCRSWVQYRQQNSVVFSYTTTFTYKERGMGDVC